MPVTVIEYCPAGVAPKLVTVSDNVAGGVAAVGLIRHVGIAVVEMVEVTAQLNETVPTLLSPPRVMTAVATPAGSTAAGFNAPGVSVKVACA